MQRTGSIALATVFAISWTTSTLAVVASANLKPGESFAAKCDEALKDLASYDFGAKGHAPAAINELVAASYGKPEQRKQLAAGLDAVLRSNASRGAKDFACRQLSVIGAAAEVPVLEGLLPDEQLSHMARFALERIPDPSADAALMRALPKVRGKLLVGVINSLGNRRCAAAVPDLAKLLSRLDQPVAAAAAAAALGKIGPPAEPALRNAMARGKSEVPAAVADAALRCAEQLAAGGKRVEASALCAQAMAVAPSEPARLGAIRGLVLASGADAARQVVKLLSDADLQLVRLAVLLVREVPGGEATKLFAAKLAELPPAKQVLLVRALAQRGDAAAGPAVFKLAGKSVPAVRGAAFQTLTKLGNAAMVPDICRSAAGEDAETAQAAKACLVGMPGKDVEAAILTQTDSGNCRVRCAAIEVLGRRGTARAVPLLLKAAMAPQGALRAVALRALGETAGQSDLNAIANLLLAARDPAQIAAVESCIKTVLDRLTDKAAASEALVSAMLAAKAEQKPALLRLLGQTGSAKALELVRAATTDRNEAIRDTAIRVLCDWPDIAAAHDLLVITEIPPSETHKTLALRGYIRLAGLADLAADKKLAMCRQAMAAAGRDDEKKLVLGVAASLASADALALVTPCLANPATKEEASLAAVAIAEKIVAGRPAEVAAVMQKVLKTSTNKNLVRRAKVLLDRTGGKGGRQ
jgi:HEAT repeat protein